MQNEDESGLQILSEAGIGKLAEIQITKDDIVTIAVAKREQDLLVQREELEEEIASLRANIEKAETVIEETIEAEVETLRPTFDEALSALNACGFKGLKLELSHDWSETKSGVKLSVGVSIAHKNGDDEYGRRGGVLSASQTHRASTEVVSLIKDQRALEATLASKEKTLLQVRRELGQLTSLERQAKAHVALQLLQSTKAGKQILTMLEKNPTKLLTVKKS